MGAIGLYIHIPFCDGKCPYCDFYSLPSATPLALDDYTDALIRSVSHWAEESAAVANTVYFGGGTPSLLGAHRLERLLTHIRKQFSVGDGAEITMEVNPSRDLSELLAAFAAAGGNRLSAGMQSAHEEELRLLGRWHTLTDVQRTVAEAQRVGIENVSLDLMLGIASSSVASVCRSVDIAADMGARHISAYMLKIEPNTAYGRCAPPLPDDDLTADMYLAAMDDLDSRGFRQYEISNAAIPGYESVHNLKYWQSEPYIGIGPAASSYWHDRRFTYRRDMQGFVDGAAPLPDEDTSIAVSGEQEYACLRLRLSEGIDAAAFADRFGHAIPTVWRERAAILPPSLVISDEQGIRLTRQGFLVSNSLIRHIFGE